MPDEQNTFTSLNQASDSVVSVEMPVNETPLGPPAQASTSEITLDQLVNIAIEQDASDIHFSEGGRIALRIGGNFLFVENVETLSRQDAQAMIHEMLPGKAEQERFEKMRDMDFSYIHSSGVSFRVNIYYSRGHLAGAMRMISKHLPTMDELGIPAVMKNFLSKRQGLILVTSQTSSGKSTSIQAMLEYVNQNFGYHVITIENPIEHIFKEEKSIFSQRELGKDTLSFENALHSATREDPNLVMVSEVNDRETLDAVLNLVETGHLVIASMSTKNVRQTIEHIVAMYPHKEQEVMQDRLSENLLSIISQDLVSRIDQPGRVAVYEVLVATKGVKNIIRHGNLSQLRTAIESGSPQGMVTMDAYAYQLAENGIIERGDVEEYVPSAG